LRGQDAFVFNQLYGAIAKANSCRLVFANEMVGERFVDYHVKPIYRCGPVTFAALVPVVWSLIEQPRLARINAPIILIKAEEPLQPCRGLTAPQPDEPKERSGCLLCRPLRSSVTTFLT
jgi:hypothetical protein